MHRHGGFEGEVHGETAKGSENAADKDKTPKKREKISALASPVSARPYSRVACAGKHSGVAAPSRARLRDPSGRTGPVDTHVPPDLWARASSPSPRV